MSQKPVSFNLIRYFLKWLLALIALALILILAFPIGFYGMAMYLSPTLPSVSEITTARLEMPLQIYSQDDKLIGQYGNRISLPIEQNEVPQNLINAFLAAEDASFFEHSGISIKGLGRAVTEIVTDDEGQTGGSTITMQVAKNYFLSPERTFNRKLTELYLARRIEEELTKEEILTLYLNKIYMGEGAYGIKAGAKKYFSKSLDNLTIAEMATLAGLPKAPSQNNPVSNPEKALTRRNWIIKRMLTLGYIDDAAYEKAISAPLGVHLYQEKLDVDLPYLAEMTRHTLTERYGDAVVNSGWRVKLTVDSEAQQTADKAVIKGLIDYDTRHGWRGVEAGDEPLANFATYGGLQPAKVTKVKYRSFEAELKNGETVTIPWSSMTWAKEYISANRFRRYPNRAADLVSKGDIVRVVPTPNSNPDKPTWRLTQLPDVQGSLVSLDPEDGALIALVGGFDFRYSKFNRATQGWRQPGSTIKPLIYSAALAHGYSPDSIVSDRPIKVGDWEPKNSDGRYYGDITLRRGLYLSRNLVSIRLLQSIGTTDARHLLDQFGLDKDKQPTTLSLALGAGQVTPLQMATAYATFANGGHRIQPYFIDQIYDYQGKALYSANPQQACAVCFNERLDKTNERAVKAYDNQLEKDIARHEKTLEILRENPDIIDKLENNEDEATVIIAEALGLKGYEMVEVEDTDTATETSDAKTIRKLKRPQAKNAEEAAEILDDAQQLEAIKKAIYAERYDALPENDRLRPNMHEYKRAEQAPRILSPRVAYDMASILRDVIKKGTGRRALVLKRNDIGGKTGTTNDAKDAWFAGFQPSIVTIVWVGFDQPSTLGKREYGGVAALPIWIDFMRASLKDKPQRWVSRSNKAKSKKQKQEVIDITDDNPDGDVDFDVDKVDKKDSDQEITNRRIELQSTTTPPKAAVKDRLPPEPKPEPEPETESKPEPKKVAEAADRQASKPVAEDKSTTATE